MATYAVILSTEGTGPIELYRGDDFDAATCAYRDGVASWMTEEPTTWYARGYDEGYGHGSIELAELCPTCGMGNRINDAATCAACGADLSDDAARAIRAASFFEQARAARDDVAVNATLTPATVMVLAPRFANGTLVGMFRARIIGTYGLGYLVRFESDNVEALAYPTEITPLR